MSIVERIIRDNGLEDTVDALVERLSPADLQSLLMEIYRRRSGKIDAAALMRSYKENRFVRPSAIDPGRLHEFDRYAVDRLPQDFEILELSPVAPLGSISALAPVNQNNVLTTSRNTEVVSDSTNVMALESAIRRQGRMQKERQPDLVKLCVSQRQLRAQTFAEKVAFPHFRVLCITTAGRDTGNYQFEAESLKEHIAFYLRLFSDLQQIGLFAERILIRFICSKEQLSKKVREQIEIPLTVEYAGADFDYTEDKEPEKDYYKDLRFQMYAQNRIGEQFFLIDGGFTDWTQKLMANNKERFLSSGIGSERLLFCFDK